MSIVATLQKLEHAIVSYADASGKTIEHIGEEVLDFIEGKKSEITKENLPSTGAGSTTDSGPASVAGSTGA